MRKGMIATVPVTLILSCCFCFLVAMKINLANSDLGRHIINGKVIVEGTSTERSAVLRTNFYSYSHPDFPFINHHWGSGVIFYKIWNAFGFNGLSLFYIVTALIMFLISFGLAIKEGTLGTAMLVAVGLMPILTSRQEVRPEIFTYLFMLIFFGTLSFYKDGIIKRYWLFGLVALQLLWVNLHVGFFFGQVIVAIFLFREMLRKLRDWKEIRFFIQLLALTSLVTLINPNSLKGALYPLSIFNNYGYELYENQSIFRLESFGFVSTEFAVFKIALFFTWTLFFGYILRSKKWVLLVDSLTLVTLMATIFALTAERHLIIFAIFALLFMARYILKLFPLFSHRFAQYSVISVATIILLFGTYTTVHSRGSTYGIGLLPSMEEAAHFYKNNNLSGPIFNNYDNGSYLDFELYGREKVYVDNRPEAYPPGFFTDEYINPQLSADYWKKIDEKYHFNVIWFYKNDLTTWGREFMSKKLNDEQWVLMYEDSYSIIFIRNLPKNQTIIEKYKS
ncbi:MAG: hypothetical protein K0S38_508 [Candidatus Paceibacter sp.]|jgi:hypothetical protein|nr:hypothetical protein [Candidatus Paceibacter sp.]